jgi:hypothetical protein
MPNPMVAVAGAQAGSSLIGGSMKGRAAKRAANAQVQAAAEASRLQREMFAEQTRLQDPYRQAGLTGQNRMMELMGLGGDVNAQGYGRYGRDFSMQDYEADPGYAFRLSEGNKALERSAAARGMLMSGQMFKGAQRFGQDLASQEYQNAFNRYQTNRSNQLNPLGALVRTPWGWATPAPPATSARQTPTPMRSAALPTPSAATWANAQAACRLSRGWVANAY